MHTHTLPFERKLTLCSVCRKTLYVAFVVTETQQILSSLLYRLAIYYLNSVSEAYKNSNMELKKKMQMVNTDNSNARQ